MQIFKLFPSADYHSHQADPFLLRLELLELVESDDRGRVEAMQRDLLRFKADLDRRQNRLHLHPLNMPVPSFCISIALLCPTAEVDTSFREALYSWIKNRFRRLAVLGNLNCGTDIELVTNESIDDGSFSNAGVAQKD